MHTGPKTHREVSPLCRLRVQETLGGRVPRPSLAQKEVFASAGSGFKTHREVSPLCRLRGQKTLGGRVPRPSLAQKEVFASAGARNTYVNAHANGPRPRVHWNSGQARQRGSIGQFTKEKASQQSLELSHAKEDPQHIAEEGGPISVPQVMIPQNGGSTPTSLKDGQGELEERSHSTLMWHGPFHGMSPFWKVVFQSWLFMMWIFFVSLLLSQPGNAQFVRSFPQPMALFEERGVIFPTTAWAQVELRVPVRDSMEVVARLLQRVKKHFQGAQGQGRSEMEKWLGTLILAKVRGLDETLEAVDYEMALQMKELYPDPNNWDRPLQGPKTQSNLLVNAERPWEFPIFAREKRGVEVKIDAASTISSLFEGVANLFHAPTLRRVQHKVTLLTDDIFGLRAREGLIVDAVSNLTNYVHVQSWSAATWMTLHTAQEILDKIVNAVPALVEGRMPVSLLSPGENMMVFRQVDKFAKSVGRSVPFTSMFSLLAMPVTAKQLPNGDWSTLLHVPLTDHREPFSAVAFPNAPFKGPDGQPYQFEAQQGLIGITKGLPAEIRAVYIPEATLHTRCLRFNRTFVCPETPVIKDVKSSCPAGLLLQANPCRAKRAENPEMPIVYNNHLSVFLPNGSFLALQCPGQPPNVSEVSGQVLVSLQPNCQVSTDQWTHVSPKAFYVSNVTTIGLNGLPGWGRRGFPTMVPWDQTSLFNHLRGNLSRMVHDLRSEGGDLEDGWSTQNVVVVSVTVSFSLSLGSGLCWLIYRICKADQDPGIPWWTSAARPDATDIVPIEEFPEVTSVDKVVEETGE